MGCPSEPVCPTAPICPSSPRRACSPCAPRPIVCCPKKDQAWRWQTTNSEYGKFYVSIHREVEKRWAVHRDCNQKCADLGRELNDCKAELEQLKLCSGRKKPCKPCPDVTCSSVKANSPKIGNCECPSKPGPPQPDQYISEAMNNYNGGKKHDPQFLMEHIRTWHPRLVKRLQPKLPMQLLRNIPCDHQGDHYPKEGGGGYDSGGDDNFKSNGMSYGGYNSNHPAMADSGGGYKPKMNMTGLYKRGNTPKRSYGEASGSARPSSAGGGANLRPSQRYNFYRYYVVVCTIGSATGNFNICVGDVKVTPDKVLKQVEDGTKRFDQARMQLAWGWKKVLDNYGYFYYKGSFSICIEPLEPIPLNPCNRTSKVNVNTLLEKLWKWVGSPCLQFFQVQVTMQHKMVQRIVFHLPKGSGQFTRRPCGIQ